MSNRSEWENLLASLPAPPARSVGGSAAGAVGAAELPNPDTDTSTRPGRRHARNYRRERRRIQFIITPNLTAMIDTIFNMLFLFIIISRFGAIEGMLPAKMPARTAEAAVAPAGEVPRIPIRIRMLPDPTDRAGCRITIDRFHETPLPVNELPAAMRAIRDAGVGFDRQTPVHLLARDDVIWDHVVNAYNAAMAAEFEKIYFAGAP